MTVGSSEIPPRSIDEVCSNCGGPLRDGALFCERCGAIRPSLRSVPPVDRMDWRTWAVYGVRRGSIPGRSHWRRVVKGVMAFMMLTVVASIIAGLITLVYGVGLVAPDILDDPEWKDGYTLFIIVPFFIDLVTLTGYALLVYYLLIVAAIVIACAWVLLTSYRPYQKELMMKAETRVHSKIFDVSGLIFLDMFVLIVIILLALLFGVSDSETGVTGTTSELLFGLANASVWEELIVRVLLLGLPLLLIDLVRKKGHKEWQKYVFGGGFSFGMAEVVLLVVSAGIFGYAHFLGGWEAWVVPWDALGGLALGYLFLRHGLAAAVVFHFAIDYRSLPTMVFNFSEMFEVVLWLSWGALGAIFAVYYSTRVIEFFSGKKYLEEPPRDSAIYPPRPVAHAMARQQPMPPVISGETVTYPQDTETYSVPPPRSRQFGGYVCPYCSYTEARWIDGKFLCLRCGRSV